MATIISYADNYNYAVEAGEESAKALLGAAELIQKILTTSYPTVGQLTKTIDTIKSRNDLENEINSLKNQISQDTYDNEAFKYAFEGLFGLVEDWFSQTMNEYLTSHSLKVLKTFAAISNKLGQPISAGNINL